jgi:hypothetical protein
MQDLSRYRREDLVLPKRVRRFLLPGCMLLLELSDDGGVMLLDELWVGTPAQGQVRQRASL